MDESANHSLGASFSVEAPDGDGRPGEPSPQEAATADRQPAQSTAQKTKSMLRWVGEALWIVLAVLLALAADQWRETQANQKMAQRALNSIIEEMQGNHWVLGRALPRHEQLLAEMPDSHEDWQPPPLDAAEGRFDPIFFRDTAWRTALETQALMHLDYQVVRTLTEVYTFQEAYAELNRDLIRSSFDLDVHDPDRRAAQFSMTRYFLFIFVANEKMLLETYDQALTKLGAEEFEPPKSTPPSESTPPPE